MCTSRQRCRIFSKRTNENRIGAQVNSVSSVWLTRIVIVATGQRQTGGTEPPPPIILHLFLLLLLQRPSLDAPPPPSRPYCLGRFSLEERPSASCQPTFVIICRPNTRLYIAKLLCLFGNFANIRHLREPIQRTILCKHPISSIRISLCIRSVSFKFRYHIKIFKEISRNPDTLNNIAR